MHCVVSWNIPLNSVYLYHHKSSQQTPQFKSSVLWQNDLVLVCKLHEVVNRLEPSLFFSFNFKATYISRCVYITSAMLSIFGRAGAIPLAVVDVSHALYA